MHWKEEENKILNSHMNVSLENYIYNTNKIRIYKLFIKIFQRGQFQ